MQDFDIDGWLCHFSGGSRNGLSHGPRPTYNKICLLPPHLLHRVLRLMYTLYPSWLGNVRSYLSRPAAFPRIMLVSGVRDLITCPIDALGWQGTLSRQYMRSV